MVTQSSTDRKRELVERELVELVMELSQYVNDASRQAKPVHEVEKDIWQRVRAMGHEALRGFIAGQGHGDVGETFTMPDGQELKRLESTHRRSYQSIFGEYVLDRVVYGSREGQKIEFVPLDHRLQLPESEFSYVLQDWNQALGVEHSFAGVDETIQMILGLNQSVDSLERMNRQMAADVEGFRLSRQAPPAEEEGQIVVVSMDNKGIPMRRPAETRPEGSHRKKGEKANKKQMATVGAVYTVDPKMRTPDEVVAALFGDTKNKKPKQKNKPPVAQHKRVWSSLTMEREGQIELGEDVVWKWLVQEEARRNPKGDKDLVCLMDGQQSLWNGRESYLPREDVVEILDLLHVTPRLWEAAHLFHREGSDGASTFVRQRLLGILKGQAGYVIGGMRQMGTKQKLRGHKANKLRVLCNYLEKNRDRMKYDEYLASGYPIASGIIEGACRHVVKDRMERAGMRWSVTGAQAMLDLRTTYVNGQWNEFQTYRIDQAKQRQYPHPDALEAVDWPIAA